MHKLRLTAFILAIASSVHGEAMAGCVPCPDIASLNQELSKATNSCGNGCTVKVGDWAGWSTIPTPTIEVKPGLQITGEQPVRLQTANASKNPQCLYKTNQENVGFLAENPYLKDCKFPAPSSEKCTEKEFSCS